MNKRAAWLALALAFTGGSVFAQDALTEAQVRTTLEAGGYTKVNDVKFEDGVWKADARSANGNRVDVRIDAQSGAIYPDEQVANLTQADVQQLCRDNADMDLVRTVTSHVTGVSEAQGGGQGEAEQRGVDARAPARSGQGGGSCRHGGIIGIAPAVELRRLLRSMPPRRTVAPLPPATEGGSRAWRWRWSLPRMA